MEVWRRPDMLTAEESAFLARIRLETAALEVCCHPGHNSFSVVERAGAGFHWGTFHANGECLDDGTESTIERARQVALEALGLWRHRCLAAGTTTCPGICNTSVSTAPRSPEGNPHAPGGAGGIAHPQS